LIVLVADAGGTRIKVALMRNQSVLAEECLATRSHEGFAPQLPRIALAFQSLCERTGIKPRDSCALGLAFPSLIELAKGRIRSAYGKYEDAPGLDLRGWARDTLGLPLVIENDALMALLGEWQAGAGRGSDDLVMVTLGTGLGTAALINGHLVRGKHGQAGALGGHLTVRQNGRRCTCGNRGCAEAEASTYALPSIAAEQADFCRSALRELDVIDYAAVMRLAREKDACAMELRTQAIEIWSSMIVNLIHAYDPERVVVGGGILAGAADFFPDLKHRVQEHAHTPWGRVAILSAELGDTAALFGAEYLVRETFSDSPPTQHCRPLPAPLL
jgi:glucokinase